MPLWLQLVIIFIVSISGIAFHIVLIKKIRVWAINDQIEALSEGNPEKKVFLEQQHQKLIADKVHHKTHQERLIEAAKTFKN